MNILIISQHFWPENFRINDVAKDLNSKGNKVYILTGKPNYPDGKFYSGYSFWGCMKDIWRNVEIYRVPLVARGKSNYLDMILNYLSFVFFASMLGPFLLRKKKIDIVFVYATSPLLQAFAAIPFKFFYKSKIIIWVQDLWPDVLFSTGYVSNKLILKLNVWIAWLLYFSADRILVQSEAFRMAIEKLIKNKKIFCLPNPVDNFVFYGKELSKYSAEFNSFKNTFNIAFTGNIGRNQSIETIIKAAVEIKEYTNIKILIFGSGSMLGYLASEIKRLNLDNLKIMGRYPPETMPTVFSLSDVLLVTLSNMKNLNSTIPCKVQSYMSSGKPILASVNGETARIVKEANCGLVCDADNYINLAECIVEFYKMQKSKRDKLGRNGQFYAKKNYDPAVISELLLGHFKITLHE
jgi:glycosyltransferase involved in cell wall biosynthesis